MENHEEESLGFTYDVFISFRGEDTRHGFLGYLREMLSHKGINTFVDDKNLRMGESISPALSKAIEESRIFIVVFSENYASSTWCLDELVKILECSRANKQLVFPIFYHVDPSDIRHQRKRYGEHMTAHEQSSKAQNVQAWKSALTEACNFPGQHIAKGSDKYEIDLIKEIVEKVHKNVAPKPLHAGENPVGLGPRIEEVKSLLDMKLDDVRMLGIYGLGGIGKTELSKALYNNIVRDFDAASFLADVKDKSNKNRHLEDLQKTLLSEMKEELETELGSTDKGMYEIKRRLRQKKVLLVLDDVDDKDQLEKLAGGRDWFGKGSRIIITTRDKDVLLAHQVEEIYEMKELDESHSLELFCWNAFNQSQPKAGFKDVSLRAMGFAKRLPLALKIIGSDLAAEQTPDDWETVLKDYERNHPNEKIHGVLKTSYDRLGSNPKQVFLDIACFFKGEKKNYVENILEEFSVTTSIKILYNKSLLTIEDGCLKMHDLIQDMCREIVRQESSNPGERSRVWHYEDVIDILTDDLGTEKIEGIMLDPPQKETVDWSGTAFEKMKRLRILIVRNTSFSPEPEYLPNQLRVLDWEEYPSKSFPLKFHPKKIVVFNLPKSHLTLQEPFKEFSRLIMMDFSYNQSITEIPDVSKVQNLREMRLDNCRELVAVHESVGFLKKLAHLSTSGCTKLRKFPQTMFLPCLEVLDLNFCLSLEHFPEIKEEMKTPLKIYMINTSIRELPESIGKLIGLVSIEISNSRKLEFLPSSLFMLPNVVSFQIEGCPLLRESFRCFMLSPSSGANVRPTLEKLRFTNANLSDEDLHAILYCFPKLHELIASENNFFSIPAHIKECVHLTSLDVNNCEELENIPECIKLRVLDVHGCHNLEEISKLPSTIQKVDARYCFSLTRETSDMLWFQVKEIRGMEVVMPFKTEFHADLFNFETNGRNPQFWVRRGKFLNIVVALVFHFQGMSRRNSLARRQVVDLRLLINGQLVPRKGNYNFIVDENHVLIFDLGRLFSDEKGHGLEAFLKREWNVVQVLYEATSTLSVTRWGAYVYREGTNMEDAVQFTCPNPECSDTPPTEEVAIKDPKQELRMMIKNLGLDLSFEKTLAEYLKNQERSGFAVHKNCMDILFPDLKKISDQAREALTSENSALDDPKSELSQLLERIKNDDDGECSENKFFNIGDELMLIRLKDPLKLEGYNNGYDPERQRIWKVFREGMTEGLVEAQKSFPSLNIVKTKSNALNKGKREGWLFDIPEAECASLQLSIETGLRIEGIVNALLEAKLSFPDLDVWATLDAILCRNGMKGLHWRLRPFLQVILDHEQQEIMRQIFCEGMTDGLVEAQDKFPSMDIDRTRSAALNKVNIHRVVWSLPPEVQGEEVETRIYINGVVNGLREANLSFPDLDVSGTLNGLLSKKDLYAVFLSQVTPSVPDNRPVEALRNRFLSDHVGETSNSSHQEDPQVRGRKLRKIFCDGMADGLVEARNIFPSLDIDTTINAAWNNANRHKIEWPLSGPPGYPPMSDELKMYVEGIVNGLREAKLSFPDLDVWATLDAILCRYGMEGVHWRLRPFLRVILDREQQEIIKKIFCEGMTDGLVEAHDKFPSLDIDRTRSAALNKGNIHGVAWSLPPELQDEGVETRIYIDGVVNGLHEAKLSFPDLDVSGTLNGLLCKRDMNTVFVAPVPPSVPDNRLVEAPRNMYLSDRVGETSNSGHQEDPQVREQKMRKIFCDGMTDGLVEARNIFPSLDIDRTISAALNKGNSQRIEWPLSGPPGYPPMSDELKMYIEGTFNGLREAKLSFPDLDSQAIFRTVFLRTSYAALGLPPLPACTVLKERAEELGRQYNAAIDQVYQNSEEFQDLISATYLSGLRDGLLEAHATYTEQLVIHCTAGLNCETKYEKMGDVLQGRVEELGRQYEAEIEGFQNSEECDDLMSATYLNGLRDGLLQAQEILLAFHV